MQAAWPPYAAIQGVTCGQRLPEAHQRLDLGAPAFSRLSEVVHSMRATQAFRQLHSGGPCKLQRVGSMGTQPSQQHRVHSRPGRCTCPASQSQHPRTPSAAVTAAVMGAASVRAAASKGRSLRRPLSVQLCCQRSLRQQNSVSTADWQEQCSRRLGAISQGPETRMRECTAAPQAGLGAGALGCTVGPAGTPASGVPAAAQAAAQVWSMAKGPSLDGWAARPLAFSRLAPSPGSTLLCSTANSGTCPAEAGRPAEAGVELASMDGRLCAATQGVQATAGESRRA